MGSAYKYSVYFLFLSTCILACVTGSPVQNTVSNRSPQGKQGILEIPKQAATIIRGWLDQNLETFLGLTTPKPQPNVPASLHNSVVGNLILGTLTATIAPAEYGSTTTEPSVPTEAQPVFISNEPSYNGQSKLVDPTTTVPPTTIKPKPVELEAEPDSNSVEVEAQTESAKPAKPSVRPADTPAKATEISAKPEQVKNPYREKVTTKKPVKVSVEGDTFNSIYNSYGTLVNTPDEVYWVPDVTGASVIIPIEPSTTPVVIPTTEAEYSGTDGESPSEPSPFETTTEEDEEEGIDEADAKKRKY